MAAAARRALAGGVASRPDPIRRLQVSDTRGKADTWSAPGYAFANVSTDVTSIFCTGCDKVGLRWTAAFPNNERKAVTIYVSRTGDVARMDQFIGPKT